MAQFRNRIQQPRPVYDFQLYHYNVTSLEVDIGI